MSSFDPLEEEDEPDGSTVQGLVHLVEAQRSLLVSVATGGPQISSVENAYRNRRQKLVTGLPRFGLADPFPWRSLWDWYGEYSATMPTYAARRSHINFLANPVLSALEALQAQAKLVDWGIPPESWGNLEARLDGLKNEFISASSLDEWQDVGRRAREIIIDATNLVFDDSMVPEGEEPPQRANAKRRIDLILETRVPGEAHEPLRKVMRAAWDLAQKVTHSSSISRVDTFAAAQATVLLVRTLAEIDAMD